MSGSGWVIPVMVIQILLPVAAAMTGAVCSPIVPGILCAAAAIAGGVAFPTEALPVVLVWCAGWALTTLLPMKKRLLRPALRAGVCLAAWGIGLFILLRLTGGQIVAGLAGAACDWVDKSSNSTEILLRAYSAGYARLQGTQALMPAVQTLGSVLIPDGIRTQMLLSLRASMEEILPNLL